MQALVIVHKLVPAFPEYERYGLVDQIRRASKSIPANIAEGYGRRSSTREFKRFLNIALGSANEMFVHLEVAQQLSCAEKGTCLGLVEDYEVVGKMVYRLGENWRLMPSEASRTRPKPAG